MTKLLVCLANSWKLGGSCLAGIEVQRSADEFVVVRNVEDPVWIRPVSDTQHGELPIRTLEQFKLLDIIQLECTKAVPQGAQVENWLFARGTLKKVGEFPADRQHLDLLMSSDRAGLFGNQGKAVHSDDIDTVGHSLLFIRTEEPTLHHQTTKTGRDQLRIRFLYNGTAYDLPLTDPVADRRLRENPKLLAKADAVFLTLSLGLEQNQFHTKLIAGVVFESTVEATR